MKRILLMTVMLTFLLVGCAGEKSQSGTDNQEEEAYVLTFEASTIEGAPLTSECFADSKLTMINVWATYCNPCISEMPDLGEIAASYDRSEFQIKMYRFQWECWRTTDRYGGRCVKFLIRLV